MSTVRRTHFCSWLLLKKDELSQNNLTLQAHKCKECYTRAKKKYVKHIPFKTIFKFIKYAVLVLIIFVIALFIQQSLKKVPTEGDWKDTLKVLSTAEFKGDKVTVKNIRNFQFDDKENVTKAEYYDKTYDLNTLKKVWFVTEPFNPGSPFSHTFLSFEFSNGSFLAITIEARLTKQQKYSMMSGLMHTFPLMYIAADERDVMYVRTSTRNDDVYVYPLKASPEQGRILLVDMLNRMNDLAVHPTWYNSIYANCTSSIAHHVNKLFPGLLPTFDWQVILTSYADKLAYDKGLLDTDLPIEQARKKFYVTDISNSIGRVENYSKLIRHEQ
jgi:hypothetical protein